MRSGDAALLDHRHRHLAEALRQLRVVLEQLQQADRAGQPGLAAADDRDADLDALVLGVRRRADELLAAESTGGGNWLGAAAIAR